MPLPLSVDSEKPIPEADLAKEFHANFAGKGGWPDLRPLFVDGRLPKGLEFENGVLSGIPEESGDFPLTVIATDARLQTATKVFTLVVQPPALRITTESPLVSGKVKEEFEVMLATEGGWGEKRTFRLVSQENTTKGAPGRTGLELTGNGVLKGTPTGWGEFKLTIEAKDERQKTSEPKEFELTIEPPPIAITVPAKDAKLEVKFGDNVQYKIFTEGGWAPVKEIKCDPAIGLKIVPEGRSFQLKGTVDTAGDQNFVFTAYDSKDNASAPQTLIVSVAAEPPIFGVLECTAAAGVPINHQIATSKGHGIRTVTHTGKLPEGIAFVNGLITGTIARGGNQKIQVRVTDQKGTVKDGTFTIKVSHPPVVITRAECRVNNGRVGEPYDGAFKVGGGTGSSYKVTIAGTLPTSMTQKGLRLIGSPTQSGTFTLRVTGEDSAGSKSAEESFIFDIYAPLVISTEPDLGSITLGDGFANTFAATGGHQPVKHFQIVRRVRKRAGWRSSAIRYKARRPSMASTKLR